MCAGAILNARLSRLVYGAADAKAGAAGSVVNLFTQPSLNHHTVVEGGVLADACAATLQDFFRARRQIAKLSAQPLREDTLRSSDSCFDPIQRVPWVSRYVSDLPTLDGLRLHYLDEGAADATDAVLCIHGASSWGYAFKRLISQWTAQGKRVIVPDLIGFGRSDKPKRASIHTVSFHSQILLELLARLELKSPMAIVLQDDFPESSIDRSAAEAPFPDLGYRAALSAFNAEDCSIRAIVNVLRTCLPAR